VDVFASHTGEIRFLVEEGSTIDAVSGEWKHILGTALFEITRERNPKKSRQRPMVWSLLSTVNMKDVLWKLARS